MLNSERPGMMRVVLRADCAKTAPFGGAGTKTKFICRHKARCRSGFASGWLLKFLILGILFLGVIFGVFRTPENGPRLPGEFEDHACLMLSWPALRPGTSTDQRRECDQALGKVIKYSQDRMQTLIVTPNESVKESALQQLADSGADTQKIEFIQANVDRPWIRDFGPRMVTFNDGHPEIVSFKYHGGTPNSQDLNQVPLIISQSTGIALKDSMLSMAGGNLLSNGAGLAVTTEGWDRRKSRVNSALKKQLGQSLKQFCGVQELVVLEPLQGEPTRHVDMFVTFVAPDVVIVGQSTHSKRTHNSEVLDRNATRLAGIKTPYGPLKVHRIPMPSPSNEGWYTYNNVVFANGTLIVPGYKMVDPRIQQRAIDVYRSLLPDWSIEIVESSSMLHSGGALHCATMNVYSLGEFRPSQSTSETLP